MLRKMPSKKKIQSSIRSLLQSKTTKNFFVSSFGSLLLRGIGFLFTPITMRILSLDDYGVVGLTASFVAVLSALFDLGLRGLFSMEYFHLSSEQRKIKLNNIILIYLAFSVVPTVLLCLFPYIINRFVFSNNAPNILIVFAVLFTFLSFFTELFYSILSYQKKVSQMTIIQISVAVTTIAFSFLFLCYFKWGVMSLITSQLIGTVIVCVIGLKAYLRKSCHKKIKTKAFVKTSKGYLSLSIALVPGLLCSSILASGDRMILGWYSSLGDVAIYSTAAVFGQLFHLVILLPMQRVYAPAVLEKFSQNKDDLKAVERWNKKIMILAMIGLLGISLVGYIICKPILRMVLSPAHYPAISYILLILIGRIFLLGEYFVSLFIIFHKKFYFQAAALFIPSALNVLLNILLIPYFNITGCVFATLISYALYFLIKLFYNLHLCKKYSPTS